jgi:hypothetical protein
MNKLAKALLFVAISLGIIGLGLYLVEPPDNNNGMQQSQ